MKEKIFRTIVDSLYTISMKCVFMINSLESVGLLVEDEIKPGMHELYGIRDKASETLVDMFGPMEPTKRDDIIGVIDQFLVQGEYQDADKGIPDNKYQELLQTLEDQGLNLPWKNETKMKGER